MVSPIVCSPSHTADRRRGHTTAAGQGFPLKHPDGPRRRLQHLVSLVAMLRLATLTFLAAIGWAPVAGASPVRYYFEAPSFTDLPDPIPTDEPTACDDNIRHAQTNCGVSFVSMLFTIDSDECTCSRETTAVGREMSGRSRCQGVTHSMASSSLE